MDYAAGDLFTCVAGGLGVKIIHHIVHDHCATKDIHYVKAACCHHYIGITVAGHQGRQITGVVGVHFLGGVIVNARVGKIGSCAAVFCMDVKSKEACVGGGQPLDDGFHQNAVPQLIESHLPT